MKINSELTEKIKNQEIIIGKLREENKILNSQTRNDKTRTNTINNVNQNRDSREGTSLQLNNSVIETGNPNVSNNYEKDSSQAIKMIVKLK